MSDQLADLPDDVKEMIAPHMPETPDMLAAISVTIAKKRDEAKAARTSSGVETTWRECEEAYIGIDDANRHEFQNSPWSKPMSPDGPVTTGRDPVKTDHKSTVYVRLTSRYVDAGAAKLGEILLSPGDKSFSFSETPVPELIKAKDDNSQVVHDGMGNIPLTRSAQPGEVPPAAPAAIPPATGGAVSSTVPPAAGAAPAAGAVQPAGVAAAPASAAPPQVPLTVGDFAKEAIEMARKKAKAAETRIYNWLVDCQYQAEMRKVIFDAARLGVGILKGPFPKAMRGIAVTKAEEGDGVEIQIEDRISPAAKWLDPWNAFPDPSSGEDIHEGEYFFERDYLSERQVRDLCKIPGYIESQIEQVLKEGPDKSNADDNGNMKPKAERKDRFEIWYYYGALKREEMDCICAASGGKPEKAQKDASEQVYAIATLINDTVIRATINPLDTGEFPYHSMPWQRRAGSWAGIGVSEQIRTPQKMLNAGTRAMLNNAGKSAGSQFVVDRAQISPADGSWTITPDKVWNKMADSPGTDVRAAFMAIEIPNVTDALMKIIDYALQLAEESTSIPLITQGQSGPTTPDTFGAAQLQNNNANQLLRSIGYSVDDNITEPFIRQMYEWLLLDPDVPDEEKGEFTIDAHGSIALVERAIQDQFIVQIGPTVKDPSYGADPKKWFELLLKSKRIDPADVQYTPEQQAKIDATPPQPPVPVAVAQVNADTTLKVAAMRQTTDQQSQQSEERIEQAAQTLEGKHIDIRQSEVATKATVGLHEIQSREKLAMLEYANRRGISLDEVKADLAKTAMTLNTQKELNAADNAVDLNKHHNPGQRPPKPQRGAKPPAQLPGRAGNGRAFEQGPQG